MNLVYNSDVLSEADYHLSVGDRAFQYGDGLFETIRCENSRLWFWPDHADRLRAGISVLRFNNPDDMDVWPEIIHQLLTANDLLNQPARIKIQVWRQSGGLYTPASNKANVLITARPGTPFSVTHRPNTGLYVDYRLSFSLVSGFKTLNALPYVLAGVYKKEQGFDDVILLDTQGHLAECVASNLFWFSSGRLHTPSLQTGCINGIARRQILRAFPDAQQGLYLPAVLDNADLVFAANVMGIQIFRGEAGALMNRIEGLFV